MAAGAARVVPAAKVVGKTAKKADALPVELARAAAARRARAREAAKPAAAGVGLAVSNGVDAIHRVPTMHIEVIRF